MRFGGMRCVLVVMRVEASFTRPEHIALKNPRAASLRYNLSPLHSTTLLISLWSPSLSF